MARTKTTAKKKQTTTTPVTVRKRTKPPGSGRARSNLTEEERLAKKRDDYEKAKKKREEEKRLKAERGEPVRTLPKALEKFQFKKVYEKSGVSEKGIGKYEISNPTEESSMRKKKAPTMSKDQYNKLLESHLNFQKKHKDFFNAKASGLGALPLYKTPSDDTVANYQEIPVCGLDPRGVFYYPHVKIQYDESGEKVKSKKVSCRKKIKRIKELGKYVRSEDSKVITGRNKKTVKFILGGFEGRRKTGEPETFGIKDFLKLLKVKNSKAPAKDDLKHIQLRLLRRIVRVFWEIPTDVAEDMKRAEIEDAIIENWKNRNLDVEISIKGEVREKAKRTKETTGKRKRTSTKEASSRKTKRAKE